MFYLFFISVVVAEWIFQGVALNDNINGQIFFFRWLKYQSSLQIWFLKVTVYLCFLVELQTLIEHLSDRFLGVSRACVARFSADFFHVVAVAVVNVVTASPLEVWVIFALVFFWL